MLAMLRTVAACVLVTSGCHRSPAAVEVLVAGDPPFDAGGRLTESIGVETLGGVFTPLLQAGCNAPCSKTEIYSTAVDRQTEFKVHVYRGAGARIEQNRDLGTFSILDIPPAPRGTPKIEVSFRASRDGVFLSVRDLAGAKLRIARVESP